MPALHPIICAIAVATSALVSTALSEPTAPAMDEGHQLVDDLGCVWQFERFAADLHAVFVLDLAASAPDCEALVAEAGGA